MRIEFTQKGTFQALYAAEAWCREQGISVGQSSATGPTGLLFGKYDWIAKWRNLTRQERAELHGTMDGDFREGPVVIKLKDSAVEAHAPGLKAKIKASTDLLQGKDRKVLELGQPVVVLRGNPARGPESGLGFGRSIRATVVGFGDPTIGQTDGVRCRLEEDDPHAVVEPKRQGQDGFWASGQVQPIA